MTPPWKRAGSLSVSSPERNCPNEPAVKKLALGHGSGGREARELPRFRQYGKLTRATGLVMEAVGLKLPIGALCIVERQTGQAILPVECEVVGFNGQTLYLMPLEHVDGILPGARVYAPEADKGAGKQLPVGLHLLGRVLDAQGPPLDGRPPAGKPVAGLFTPSFNPLHRDPIKSVLDVGVRAINGLLTVGRGQRMGLLPARVSVSRCCSA